MKLLDLASFKKIKQDKNTTEMQHKDGHVLTILHSRLPKIQQEQIKRLPFNHGGKVDSDADEQDDNAPPSSPLNPGIKIVAAPGMSENVSHGLPAENMGQVKMTDPNSTNPDIIQGSSDDSAQPETQSSQAQTASASGQSSTGDSFEKAASAAESEAIKGETGAVKSVDNAYSQVQKLASEFNEYQNENPINPNHYAESMDSNQKTGTAIGLALMGFGGTGQAGLDFLNKQIDRDVAAQQQNINNKKTVFGAYQEMFGDSDIAAKMALATTNDIYKHRMAIAAYDQGTPQAQQVSQNFAAQKNAQNQQIYNKVAQDIAAKPDENGIYSPTPILKPNATRIIQGYTATKDLPGNPIGANYPEIQKQYDTAFKADNVLKQLPEQFKFLKDNSTPGGALGRNKGTGALLATAGGATGGIGGAIAGALEGGKEVLGSAFNAATGGKEALAKDRNYESAKTRLYGDITNALRGTNVGGEQVADLVNKNTPDFQDTPENVTTKMRTIEMFIKNAAKGPMLGGITGLANE